MVWKKKSGVPIFAEKGLCPECKRRLIYVKYDVVDAGPDSPPFPAELACDVQCKCGYEGVEYYALDHIVTNKK